MLHARHGAPRTVEAAVRLRPSEPAPMVMRNTRGIVRPMPSLSSCAACSRLVSCLLPFLRTAMPAAARLASRLLIRSRMDGVGPPDLMRVPPTTGFSSGRLSGSMGRLNDVIDRSRRSLFMLPSRRQYGTLSISRRFATMSRCFLKFEKTTTCASSAMSVAPNDGRA